MQIKEALDLDQQSQQLFDADQVDQAISELADTVAEPIKDDFPLTIDYVHATRYRLATLGRDVLWKAYPQNSLKNRHVIIVDDIFDQGYTLEEVKSYCMKQGAKKCTSVFLIRKQHQRKRADIEADFVALECGDLYVYGSGMDLHSHFRNLSGIHAIPAEKSGR
ncbi:MAG: hypothetical protein HOE78_14935 [Gammaproteobacteria bacterium]|nr:hypothetical protein [Gammaproteobacteria bacterium]